MLNEKPGMLYRAFSSHSIRLLSRHWRISEWPSAKPIVVLWLCHMASGSTQLLDLGFICQEPTLVPRVSISSTKTYFVAGRFRSL